MSFYIHDDFSVEVNIDGEHAIIPETLFEEILEALQEKEAQLQEQEDDEIQTDQSFQSESD